MNVLVYVPVGMRQHYMIQSPHSVYSVKSVYKHFHQKILSATLIVVEQKIVPFIGVLIQVIGDLIFYQLMIVPMMIIIIIVILKSLMQQQ